MEVPYWEDLDAYVRNSAVFNIETLDTPLLVEVADADRNVDWRQGIEYFNAARRAGKPLVMVAYHDEGHGLRKKPTQVDYHRRILQWVRAPPQGGGGTGLDQGARAVSGAEEGRLIRTEPARPRPPSEPTRRASR